MSVYQQASLAFVICGVIGYLLGSISFAVIFTRIYASKDVRDFGSGNAGMTNVFRTAGKVPGVLTLVFDVLKAVVSVAIAKYGAMAVLNITTGGEITQVMDPICMAYAGGFGCMVGHMFPLYFGFRGGKGVLTSLGTVLMIDWRVGLLGLSVFILLFLCTKIVSLGSICAAVSLPILTYFLYPWINGTEAYRYSFFGLSHRWMLTILAGVIMLVILITHRANIRRLLRGEEKPLRTKK